MARQMHDGRLAMTYAHIPIASGAKNPSFPFIFKQLYCFNYENVLLHRGTVSLNMVQPNRLPTHFHSTHVVNHHFIPCCFSYLGRIIFLSPTQDSQLSIAIVAKCDKNNCGTKFSHLAKVCGGKFHSSNFIST